MTISLYLVNGTGPFWSVPLVCQVRPCVFRMRRIVRRDEANEFPKRRRRPAFPSCSERIDYSQTILDKLISNREVSELVLSFEEMV